MLPLFGALRGAASGSQVIIFTGVRFSTSPRLRAAERSAKAKGRGAQPGD